jgi:hypothetical protein
MLNLTSVLPASNSSAGSSPDRTASDGDHIPLVKQYLRIAFRWRIVIGGIVATCVMLGIIVTLLMTPQYTATTVIEISRESDKVTDFRGVDREASVADQEFYQTQYGLLRSRSLSERVASQLGLVDDAAFFEMFGISDGPAFEQLNGRYIAHHGRTHSHVAPSGRSVYQSGSEFFRESSEFLGREFHPEQSGAQNSGDFVRSEPASAPVGSTERKA